MSQPKQSGFRFSLRNMMIVLTIAGVFCGLMGQLFVTQPRLFFIVWMFSITVLPFVLAIITLFAVATKVDNKRGLRVWALLLALTPLLGGLCIPLFSYLQQQGLQQPTVARASPSDYPNIATSLLISKYLPPKVGEPWVWNELEARIRNRKLSPEEAEDALQVFIDHMKSSKPGGWAQSLPWQRQFLEDGQKNNLFSDEKMVQFLDAYFTKPTVDLRRIRENSKKLPFNIRVNGGWSDSVLGYSLLWNVKSVTIDDQVVKTKVQHRHRNDHRAVYENSLASGDHELKIVLESAYIEKAKLVGLDPWKLKSSSWPRAFKSWEETIVVPFKVYPEDDQIIQLSKDPLNDPREHITCSLIAQNENETKKMVLQIKIDSDVPISCSFEVKAIVGDGQEIPLGHTYRAKRTNSSSVGGTERAVRLDELSPEIRAADLVLKPYPHAVERFDDVEEIWGRTIVIKNVTIERYDLEKNNREE